MAAGDRKKKILEHLAQSTNGIRYDFSRKKAKSSISPTPSQPVEIPTPSSPLGESSTSTPALASPTISTATISNPSFTPLTKRDRKRQVMNHVKSSSGDFGDFSLNPEQRKRQIIEHVRKSLK
jgi:hypothetical protein